MRDFTSAEADAIDQWHAENDGPHGFECADNTRVATVGNQDEEIEYDKTQQSGCCGSVDVELVTADGVKFLYGFNYGH